MDYRAGSHSGNDLKVHVGTVTDEVVKEYIEKQDVETKDDDFKFTE